jgi:glucose-1-phosphate adenylyltransferase
MLKREFGHRTRAVLLAGGKGSRLRPLTFKRVKPMVPIAGAYRLIDFTVSNCLNSGIRDIVVIGPPDRACLAAHVSTWQRTAEIGGAFLRLLPAAERSAAPTVAGTAEALRMQLAQLRTNETDSVLVLAADHVYKMDYRSLLACHASHGHAATVAAVEVPLDRAKEFGVLQADKQGQVFSFVEKPMSPCPVADDPGRALVSMGVYVFRPDALVELLLEDVCRERSSHDLGRDILPRLAERHELVAFPFRRPDGGWAYWRDVGTVDSYYTAQMEMLDPSSASLLEDDWWPVGPLSLEEGRRRRGHALLGNSIVSEGGRLMSLDVQRSVLSPGVVVERNAAVSESVILPGVRIGAHARVRRAIVEENLTVPGGVTIDGAIISDPDDPRLQVPWRMVSGWGPRGLLSHARSAGVRKAAAGTSSLRR